MTEHPITLGIQIIPKSKENKDTYGMVDKAIAVIQQSGVKHIITPFETVMEGNHTQLMKIAEQAQQAAIDAGADECLVYYRIHYRTNAPVTFDEKRLDR